MSEHVKGEISSFPSIEEKYGKPMEFWFNELIEIGGKPCMEQVTFPKTQHGMGHGHANAIAAYVRVKGAK